MSMIRYAQKTGIALAVLATAGLAACGGGGTTATTTTTTTTPAAVALPSSASALTTGTNANAVASLAGVSAAYRALSTGAVRAFVAPTASDYATDVANTWVQVEGQESLDTINEILCFIDQAGADLVLTADGATATYAAKINATTCSSKSGGGAGTGSSASGSRGSKFTTMTVIATPKTATADETIKFWVELPADGGDRQRVHGLITATSGVTTTNPFGVWVFNYDMEFFDVKTSTWTLIKKTGNATSGTLQAREVAGQPELIYFEGMSIPGAFGFTSDRAITVRYAAGSKTVGQANINDSSSFGGGGTSTTNNALAFNASLAYIGKDTTGNGAIDTNVCRDRTNFTEHVFRYNLYHVAAGTVNGATVTAGQRVNLNTGFPFVTSTGVNGFAGVWGAWLDDGTALVNNAVVNRIDNFSTGATSQVTAHVTNGRLDKQVIVNQTVADIAGLDFQYDDFTSLTPASYKAHFDPTSGHLIGTATISWGTSGISETVISPVDLTPGTNATDLFINLFPFGFGNNYSLQLSPNTAPSLTTTVQSISYEPASSADIGAGLTLYCWQNCPTGGNEAVLHDAGAGWNFGISSQTYTASLTGGVLTFTDNSNNTPVTGSTSVPVSMWQLTTTNVAPWASGASLTQYNYSAGNSWDQMVTFTNNADGSVVVFDNPIAFSNYTHATANDRNASATYNGKTFPLTFDGFGLQGFPWIPDPDGTGWMLSAVDLKDGVQLSDGTNNYVVRGMEMQQVPKVVANSTCTTAGLSTTSILSTLTLPTKADMTAVPMVWADKPTVSGGPRVVEGVLQY